MDWVRQCVTHLGIHSNGLNVENFPTKLDPQYLTVWASFIASRACYDLWHLHKEPRAQMSEACLGFCSLIQLNAQKFVRPTTFNLTTFSRDRAVHEMTGLSLGLRTVYAKYFGTWLPNRRAHAVLDYEENKVVSALLPNSVAMYYAISSPRDLDPNLRKHSHLFADVKKLFTPHTPRELNDLKHWTEVVGGEGVMCARTRNGLLLKKVVCPTTIVYRTRLNQLKTAIEGRI